MGYGERLKEQSLLSLEERADGVDHLKLSITPQGRCHGEGRVRQLSWALRGRTESGSHSLQQGKVQVNPENSCSPW